MSITKYSGNTFLETVKNGLAMKNLVLLIRGLYTFSLRL